MNQSTIDKIVEEIQFSLDVNGGEDFEIDMWDIIQDDPELTDEEKDWAHNNLGVTLVVGVLSPQDNGDED